MADPITGLADLDRRRSQAGERIDALEQSWRGANEALAQARDALVEFERQGGPATERRTLEKTLVDAEAVAAQPWQQRADGARAAIRDVDAERQRFVAEHLDALVAEREAEGEAAAAQLTDAARQMVDAYAQRETVAGQIAALASSVGRMRPGDVSRTRAEELARAASALLADGGEEPPTLLHRPDEPRYVQVAESEQAQAVST